MVLKSCQLLKNIVKNPKGHLAKPMKISISGSMSLQAAGKIVRQHIIFDLKEECWVEVMNEKAGQTDDAQVYEVTL